jgi:hypothetical protein
MHLHLPLPDAGRALAGVADAADALAVLADAVSFLPIMRMVSIKTDL